MCWYEVRDEPQRFRARYNLNERRRPELACLFWVHSFIHALAHTHARTHARTASRRCRFRDSGKLQIAASLHPRLSELAAEMAETRAEIGREKSAVARQLKVDASKVQVDLAHGAGRATLAAQGGVGQVTLRVTKSFNKNLRAAEKQHRDRFTVVSRQRDGIHFVTDLVVTLGKRLRTLAVEYQVRACARVCVRACVRAWVPRAARDV